MFDKHFEALSRDFGLFILRVCFGLMMLIGHGWGKFQRLTSGEPIRFSDPLNIGPELSLFLATFAEVGCAALIIIGLATRFAAVPLLITMLVAAFIQHAGDPFFRMPDVRGFKELSLLFGSAFAALIFTGPGAFSIDRLIGKRVKKWVAGRVGRHRDNDSD